VPLTRYNGRLAAIIPQKHTPPASRFRLPRGGHCAKNYLSGSIAAGRVYHDGIVRAVPFNGGIEHLSDVAKLEVIVALDIISPRGC